MLSDLPFCEENNSKVIDSRSSEDGFVIRRRRQCLNCGKRFTTYERVEERPILVVKKDGSRQQFDRKKILNGLLKACEKRPVSLETIERLSSEIENEIRERNSSEISSIYIGELVMEKLKDLDHVAYVRFASVYRQFTDVEGFIQAIENLKEH